MLEQMAEVQDSTIVEAEELKKLEHAFGEQAVKVMLAQPLNSIRKMKVRVLHQTRHEENVDE